MIFSNFGTAFLVWNVIIAVVLTIICTGGFLGRAQVILGEDEKVSKLVPFVVTLIANCLLTAFALNVAPFVIYLIIIYVLIFLSALHAVQPWVRAKSYLWLIWPPLYGGAIVIVGSAELSGLATLGALLSWIITTIILSIVVAIAATIFAHVARRNRKKRAKTS